MTIPKDCRLAFILDDYNDTSIFIIFFQTHLFYPGSGGFAEINTNVISSATPQLSREKIYLKGSSLQNNCRIELIGNIEKAEKYIEALIHWSSVHINLQHLPKFVPYIVEVPDEVKSFICEKAKIKSSGRLSRLEDRFTPEDIELLSQYASYV